MNLKRRSLIFVTFFLSCLGIALLGASLGTKAWVTASCKRACSKEEAVGEEEVEAEPCRINQQASEKSNGNITFGLFEYQSSLDAGLGERVVRQPMLDLLYTERTFLIYELYIATIATVCGAIFFGAISAMMAIVNTASNPIEAICHVPGLFLWNAIALSSSLAAAATWMAQFYLTLTDNVIRREERTEGMWTSEGRASFGFSFWLVLLAALTFLGNILVIDHATRDQLTLAKGKQHQPVAGKQAGDTMLY